MIATGNVGSRARTKNNQTAPTRLETLTGPVRGAAVYHFLQTLLETSFLDIAYLSASAGASTLPYMETTPHGWKVFDAHVPILTYEYSFGLGLANALAVGANGGLVVVSPPRRATSGVFDDLLPYGTVHALVAPNAFHHLGLAHWKGRFPDAAVFAPAQSIARVEKRSKLHPIRPLAEASSTSGPHLDLVDMPHYKTGEVLVRVNTERGLVWYVTDIVMNLPALPSNLLAKLLFWISRSAPGLRFNNLAPLFMVSDNAALRAWLANEFRKAPPRWLIAAHGDIVDFTATPEAGRTLFGSI